VKNTVKKYLLPLLLVFAVASCTSKPKAKKTKTAKKYTVQKTVQPTRGFLIEGKDQDNAVNNLFDQIIDLTEAEITLINDGKNPPYYNRLLNVVIDNKATVGQVNQALKKTGVLISFSEEMNPQVTVLIPPPGGIENLKKYQSALEKIKVFNTVALEVPEDTPESIAPVSAPNQ
jgi:hypothetical protein